MGNPFWKAISKVNNLERALGRMTFFSVGEAYDGWMDFGMDGLFFWDFGMDLFGGFGWMFGSIFQ